MTGVRGQSEDLPRPMEEKQWVRRVREKGDRVAFEKIFRTYYKRLHGFARSYVDSWEEAEDIVQSVFLKIWVQRSSWDPPGTVKHYLFAAVKHKALNIIRHQKVVEDKEDEVNGIFTELKSSVRDHEESEIKELRKDIEHGIDQLPPRCQQIFMLNRRSGLTYQEIAEFLDISINTVNTQMGRALQSLRNHLSDYLPLLATGELSMMVYHTLLTLILVLGLTFLVS